MTKKKSPVKKTVKKATSNKSKKSYTEWIKDQPIPKYKEIGSYEHPNFPGSQIKIYEVDFSNEDANAVLQTIDSENIELKKQLRELTNKQQPEDMPQSELKGTPMLSSPLLEVLLNDLDKNISRFYNGMNTLDAFADRLKPSNQGVINGNAMAPSLSSVISRMERLLSDFIHLNNRLEATNNYLSEIA